MIRILAIFLTFFSLILKTPLYPMEETREQSQIYDEIEASSLDYPLYEHSIPFEAMPEQEPIEPPPIYCDQVPDESFPNLYPTEEMPIDAAPPLDALPYENPSYLPYEEIQNIIEDPIECPIEESYPPFLPENSMPSPCLPREEAGPLPLPYHGKGCPKPPGGCQPYNKARYDINPYAPPPPGSCCPPAPIRGAHIGLNAATMILPIFLLIGLGAIILSEHSETAH